jgi:hypothetical protein
MRTSIPKDRRPPVGGRRWSNNLYFTSR